MPDDFIRQRETLRSVYAQVANGGKMPKKPWAVTAVSPRP